MVTDKIQSFYGMDREAIRAAMIKHDFKNDAFFSDINKRIGFLINKSKIDKNDD
jgi:hypothetical protein